MLGHRRPCSRLRERQRPLRGAGLICRTRSSQGSLPAGRRWLVASAKLQGTVFAPEEPLSGSTFFEVLDQRPTFAVIAVNAPVGYLDHRRSRRPHVRP